MWNPVERLSPRSDGGEVCRDEFLAYFEPLFYGILLLTSVVAVVGPSAWPQKLASVLGSLTATALTRFLMFRPHLVLGRDVLVLVGVFGRRRVPMEQVREAIGSRSALQLVLVDGDKVTVPGHHWRHGRREGYADLAARINRRLAEAVAAHGDRPPEQQQPSH